MLNIILKQKRLIEKKKKKKKTYKEEDLLSVVAANLHLPCTLFTREKCDMYSARPRAMVPPKKYVCYKKSKV
jgi:L-fucose isomerase-like protein